MIDWGRMQYEGQQYFIKRVAEMKLRNPSISWEQAEQTARGVIQLENQLDIQQRRKEE